jgi:ParB-like chromosome segregation protein Spo0J
MEKRILPIETLKVNIGDIDLSPGPFCMSFRFDLEELKLSIGRFGVLNPPYLLRTAGDKFTVVAGYRRLLAISELGWKKIACHVLPATYPPLEALLLNLNDNLIHRQLNTIEKGMVLQSLAQFISPDKILKEYMPALALPATIQALELFMVLGAFDDEIRSSIAKDKISLRVVGLMRDMVREDQLKINTLLTTLKWTFNQQWEITQWIIEIASREGLKIREVVDERDINVVLKDGNMNNPQKVKAIARILRKRRFPGLVDSERLFKKGISNLALPSRVRILHPPFFEGMDYRMEIIFREGKELREKLAELNSLPGLEEVTEYWKIKNHIVH